ncbi:hypothetical protein O181_020754 [Austropuccinia psidii MF-1]|uniref:Uncharacterized protein n=1 Tax=Austropuccinia psidii MF-1 TaxID=1389203 RepID=A0A9Q3CBW0_9BASI|nr:hypothetical protein [Austropuccinia psidii MF-1]
MDSWFSYPYSFHCSFWQVETVIKELLGWLFGHLALNFSYCISSLVPAYFLEEFILLFYFFILLESFKAQYVLTPTPRAPLDSTPAVPQLRAQLDRGPHLEGRWPRRSSSFSGVVGSFPGLSRTTFKDPGEDDEEEKENSVEEEESEGTGGVPSPVGASQGTGGPTLALSNQPVSHQSEPSIFAIMQKMTQNDGQSSSSFIF